MAVVGLAPLAVALVGAVLLLARSKVGPVDRALTRIALLVAPAVPERPDRRRLLGAAAVPTTYRTYAAESWVLAALGGLIGGVVGVYLSGWMLVGLPIVAGVVSLAVSRPGLAVLVAVGGFIAAGLTASGISLWRWQRLNNRAIERRRAIDAAIPRTVAFMYALTRGGTSVTDAMWTIGSHREIYGAAADEIDVAVREMELFGADVVTATQRMASRSPSDRFRTFGENLASVLRSGRSVSEFFREQYQQFNDAAADRQAELLDRLATVAEAYVTILVAGVLFLLTILFIIGLTVSETLAIVRALVYLMIPLGTLATIVYLDQSLQGIDVVERTPTDLAPDRDERATTAVDPSTRRRLAIADRVRALRGVVADPWTTFLDRPIRSLVVTVPIAAIVFGAVVVSLDLSTMPVHRLDDAVVWALLLVAGPYSVLRALHRRRIRRVEAAVPDLLDRLASLNEAGMSIVESIERVRESDLGPLDPEVDALWRDLQVGATVTQALDRFQARVGTATVARVTTLVANAHRASGTLGPVLRIAADDVQSTLRLRHQRRQEMFTYLIVVYIAFGVFVLIALVVRLVLIPSLPEVTTVSSSSIPSGGSPLSQVGTANRAAYAVVLSHAVLVQAACSGLVAGQIGEGRVADGVKHAAIMVALAYLIVVVTTGPVAAITVGGASGTTIEVDSATLSNGGYLVVHEESADGPIVGRTDHLAPGTHGDLTIALDRPATDVEVVAYRDADRDRVFDPDRDVSYPEGPGRHAVGLSI
ncbi:type II secretion system F family protein [Halococcoides cellulosivorans]|uniref:Type II secretion system protein n=1 Tax=Halococcoides cellulosivorans TaxID=1679096 RepID=A0A2R4X097_9EURY|nr:type II secretion system F family protein [Halococcoides cellulosivorans]AWB27207.1 type II secretion system protein [Halococcoides cellulosivorans]